MSNSKLHDTLAEIRKVQEEIEKLKNIKLKAEEAVDSAKHAVKNNGDAVEAAEAKARFVARRMYLAKNFITCEYILGITEAEAIGTLDMMNCLSVKIQNLSNLHCTNGMLVTRTLKKYCKLKLKDRRSTI